MDTEAEPRISPLKRQNAVSFGRNADGIQHLSQQAETAMLNLMEAVENANNLCEALRAALCEQVNPLRNCLSI